MSEKDLVKTILERKDMSEGECKIRLHATTVAQAAAFGVSLLVLILEIVLGHQPLVYGFTCLGVCFLLTAVEKWLCYFSLKQKNEMLTAIVDSAVFLVCAAFVLLAIL